MGSVESATPCPGLGYIGIYLMPRIESINQEVASRLREGADLLEQQAANPFRISAY